MGAFAFDLPCGMRFADVARTIAAFFAKKKPADPTITLTEYRDKLYLGDTLDGLYLRQAGNRASLCGELDEAEFEQALAFLKKHAPKQQRVKKKEVRPKHAT